MVVGAGHMGRLHAEKLAWLRDHAGTVELVGVADVDADRAREVAGALRTRAVDDFRLLLGEADAALVAVPTVRHFEVVGEALKAGLHVLVEKPIAATLAEAEAILEVARSDRRVLKVGHLEWFNSAMRAVETRIRRPRFVEAHRLGPFPGRATDVDVVRDLMIHDLDIVQRLVGAEPERVEAVGVPVLSERVDIANARLAFPCGCVANFTASRVSPTPLRKIRFFQADGYFSIDFLAQSAVVFRRSAPPEGGEPRIEMEKLEIDRDDALLAQLRDFLEEIAHGPTDWEDGEAGLRALRTALRVVDALPPLDEL